MNNTYNDTYSITCKKLPFGFRIEYLEDKNIFTVNNIKEDCFYKNVANGDTLIKINDIDIIGENEKDILKLLKHYIDKYKKNNTQFKITFKKSDQRIVNENREKIFNSIPTLENVQITNTNKNTSNTFENKYIKSELNQIRRDVVKSILNVDSLFAKNRSLKTFKTNDFMYDTPEKLQNVISMRLASVEIPNIWYNISESLGNNTFKIQVLNYNDGSGNYINSEHIIKLPDGNYCATDMEEYLNNYFINNKQGLDFIMFTIDKLTGSSIFRAVDCDDDAILNRPIPYDIDDKYYSPNIVFKFNFNYNKNEFLEEYNLFYYQQTLGWYLGFDNPFITVTKDDVYVDKYITNANKIIEYKNYVKSERFYSNSIKRYIYLDCIDFQNNFKSTVLANLGGYNGSVSKNVLARIPITTGSNTILINNNSDFIFKQRNYFGPVTISKLNFRILDSFGNLLPLNNNDYSLALEITQIYS